MHSWRLLADVCRLREEGRRVGWRTSRGQAVSDQWRSHAEKNSSAVTLNLLCSLSAPPPSVIISSVQGSLPYAQSMFKFSITSSHHRAWPTAVLWTVFGSSTPGHQAIQHVLRLAALTPDGCGEPPELERGFGSDIRSIRAKISGEPNKLKTTRCVFHFGECSPSAILPTWSLELDASSFTTHVRDG